MSLNTLFLTFFLISWCLTCLSSMIFLLGEESQVSLEQFEILRGVSRKTPRFQFTYNYFVYYSYAKTLFPKHIAVSKYLQLQQHTMFTEIIIYRKYFFCILMTSSLILWYLEQKSNQFSNDSIVCLLLLRGPFISSKRNIDLSKC